MPEPLPLYCATDNEMYSSLMSAPQHFNLNQLRDMGLQRGILYSQEDDREYLIDQLSTHNYSYDQMRGVQEHFEYRGRGEKSTVVRINHAFSAKELQEAAEGYREVLQAGEKLFTHADGLSAYDVELQYIETDFSLVRLRQRQRRDARIHFEVQGDTTIVTFPSNAKALDVVGCLRDRLSAANKIDVVVEQIVLSGLPTAGSRTTFFVDLITGLKDFSLVDVVRVRVEQAAKDDKTLLDEESDPEAKEHPEEDDEMLSLVRAVALHGENLLRSKVYQDLRKRGYFITSVRWKAKLTVDPYSLVEFDAAFEDVSIGGRFRFSVLGWFPPTRTGAFRKVIAPLPDVRRKQFLQAVDERSIELYRTIAKERSAASKVEGVSQ